MTNALVGLANNPHTAATMKRSSSPDCSFIGQSLKRVKISTSPGELRLDRDIESLLEHKKWISTTSTDDHHHNNNYHYNHQAGDRRGKRIHGELYCHNARILRDPVDPLRLRLTCLHQPQNNINNNNDAHQHHLSSVSSSSPIPPERWTFLIQMPRMYPHFPPTITRVTRDFAPNEPLGDIPQYYNCYNSSASAAIVASSSMQSQMEPPVPEQILINPLPPTPSNHHGHNNNSTHNNNYNTNNTKLLDLDLATSVCNTWTPISSLQDLIDFLIGIPAKRKEWWSIESNRRHHMEQQRFFHSSGETTAAQPLALGQPTATTAVGNSFLVNDQRQNHQQEQHYQLFHREHNQYQQQFTSSSSHCDMEDDCGEMNITESMMEDQQQQQRSNDSLAISPERKLTGIARFDVGYNRTRQQWGVRR